VAVVVASVAVVAAVAVVVPAVAALELVVAVAAATAVAAIVATLSQAVFLQLRTKEMMAAPVTDAAPLVADRALLQSAEAERQPKPMHPAPESRCFSAAATFVHVP